MSPNRNDHLKIHIRESWLCSKCTFVSYTVMEQCPHCNTELTHTDAQTFTPTEDANIPEDLRETLLQRLWRKLKE